MLGKTSCAVTAPEKVSAQPSPITLDTRRSNRSFPAMTLINRILIPLVAALIPVQAVSHELWLEPVQFQAETGETIGINIRNGEDFRGLDLSWFDPRIAESVTLERGKRKAYNGLPGDLPGMSVEVKKNLITVAYASTMSTLTYDSWEKTLSFANHKDIPWFEARHAERGLPQSGVTEGYWRFSKTLITGGAGKGSDAYAGMETEFVAITNPYTDPGPVRIQLMYQDNPRTDAQVEMWEKSGKTVEKTLHRTDSEGIVTLPVKPGHRYMIDAVVLREPTSDAAIEKGVMWESLWANMTFAVPE